MNSAVALEEDNIEDKIKLIFDILEKRIRQYDQYDITKSRANIIENEKIQKLIMQEKHLSEQFERIKKDIKHYERKYEKVLKRKVKLMKKQIKEDRQKLDIIKEKYHNLNVQVDIAPENTKTRKRTSKHVGKPIKVKVMKPKLKEKNMVLSKKIRIKIKRNEKQRKRKVRFPKKNNARHAFTDLVKVISPANANTRECRIMLQRLTEEQMNQYQTQKRLGQQKTRAARVTRDSIRKVNRSEESSHRAQPSWHTKIPKTVFEESQSENTLDLIAASASSSPR